MWQARLRCEPMKPLQGIRQTQQGEAAEVLWHRQQVVVAVARQVESHKLELLQEVVVQGDARQGEVSKA